MESLRTAGRESDGLIDLPTAQNFVPATAPSHGGAVCRACRSVPGHEAAGADRGVARHPGRLAAGDAGRRFGRAGVVIAAGGRASISLQRPGAARARCAGGVHGAPGRSTCRPLPIPVSVTLTAPACRAGRACGRRLTSPSGGGRTGTAKRRGSTGPRSGRGRRPRLELHTRVGHRIGPQISETGLDSLVRPT